jgi:anti-repressor protein
MNRGTASARELHEALQIETPFRKWFPRMCEYGFSENVDYTPDTFVHPQNGQETMDYNINIDMAKQICMIQRTEKGKQCRQYFIDLEKAWNTPEQVMARALKVAADTQNHLLETIENQNIKIEQMRPKEIFADAVSTSKTSILIGELAKLICQNGYSIGQNRLFGWLREAGYLMREGASRNIPKQRYVEQGLFEVKETNIQNPDGSVRITKTTKVTGTGQIYFINKFLPEKGEIRAKGCN